MPKKRGTSITMMVAIRKWALAQNSPAMPRIGTKESMQAVAKPKDKSMRKNYWLWKNSFDFLSSNVFLFFVHLCATHSQIHSFCCYRRDLIKRLIIIRQARNIQFSRTHGLVCKVLHSEKTTVCMHTEKQLHMVFPGELADFSQT